MAAADLARARYLSLATFRKTGTEVRTPIWFAVLHESQGDHAFWMMTAGDSGKVKRLRNDPRVRVAPCDVRGIVSGPWREGTARFVSDAEAIEQARAALRVKYGWQVTLLDFFSWLSGRMKRRVWLAVEV